MKKIKYYYLYFMMYAIIGWLYEVILETFIYKWGFTNRGVLFGPYCPVYGFGALLFILITSKLLKEKKLKEKILLIPVIFLLCMISATLLELVTSYLCEFTLGSWPWQTYKDYKYNFEARIALSPSIRFGIGGVIFMYILQPIFEYILNKLGNKKVKNISTLVLIIFIIDIICTIISKLI